MKIIVTRNGNESVSSWIMDEEDVTVAWLLENSLTAIEMFETVEEAEGFLEEEGWEYDPDLEVWMIYAE